MPLLINGRARVLKGNCLWSTATLSVSSGIKNVFLFRGTVGAVSICLILRPQRENGNLRFHFSVPAEASRCARRCLRISSFPVAGDGRTANQAKLAEFATPI